MLFATNKFKCNHEKHKTINFWIAPSILAADFARLGEETLKVQEAGANAVHLDIMDNHFVPNLTVGPMMCQALRNYGITVPIDVHLMTTPVDQLAKEFARAGASYISFHPEATSNVARTVEHIKVCGCKVGLAFNPSTPIDYLDYLLDKLDFVLLMAVNPGFSGQKFISSTYSKIAQVRKLIDFSNSSALLHVDGGITVDNIGKIVAAGSHGCVVGSAIFNHHNYRVALNLLRQQLAN